MPKKIELEFFNYKLLQNKTFVFEGSNLYLIMGGNEKGKTSVINGLRTLCKAENTTKEPVTNGEKEGHIIGKITLADNKTYTIKFEFSLNDKEKFTLVDPDGKVSKRVTDIRELFQFNDFTAEEFVAWGKTADGRKKQKNIILGLLPAKVQQEFVKLEADEKTFYDRRTGINASYDATAKLIGDKIKISEEDQKGIDNLDNYRAKLKQFKDDLTNNSMVSVHNKTINDLKKSYQETKEVAVEIITDEEDKNNFVVHTAMILETLDKYTKVEQDVVKLREKIDKGTEIIQYYENLVANKKNQDEQLKQLAELQKEKDEFNKHVEDTRKKKQELIINAKLPFDDIEIGEDGIMIKTPKGLLPLNDEQISTSRIMKLTIKLITLLNTKFPIVFVGKAAEFDMKSVDEMAQFAEENGAWLFCDKVIDDDSEVEIIGYESKGEKPVSIPKTKSEGKAPGDEKPPVETTKPIVEPKADEDPFA